MDNNDIDLSGKVAVITGGGGGIGRAIALCMADMGADIAIIESIPERCEQMRDLIGQRGRQVLAVECNVMEADKLREAMDSIKERFGRIDILVNNAGGVAPREVREAGQALRRHRHRAPPRTERRIRRGERCASNGAPSKSPNAAATRNPAPARRASSSSRP